MSTVLGLKNLRTGSERRRQAPTPNSITQKRKAHRAAHGGAMCDHPEKCKTLREQGR